LHFAPDTEDTLRFLVDLVNTAPGASRTGADELATTGQLTAVLSVHGFTGRFDRDEKELAEAVEARALLRRIWALDADTAVPLVNQMFADANTLLFLAKHDQFDWHLHATEADAPLVDRVLGEAAIALADVLRSQEWSRLRECGADDCDGVFVDLSRNGSKRFCSVRCGNRMNMVAFRERQTEAD
jgi:hypothetical protein